MYEWDENKRQNTIEKYGLDFVDAIDVFETAHVILPARSDTENRKIAVGEINGILIAVIFTMRGSVTRLITARRARKNEREIYKTLIKG